MKTKILILVLLFLSSFNCFSQNSLLSIGTTELGGELGFVSQSSGGASATVFSSSVFVGFMVSPGFEMGFRPGFQIQTESGSSNKMYNLYLNPSYNFNTTSGTYPYLGFIIGYNSVGFGSQSYSGIGIGGEGGMKFQITGNGLLLFKFEYLSQHYDESGFSSGTTILNNVSFGFGFRVFLPKAVYVKK